MTAFELADRKRRAERGGGRPRPDRFARAGASALRSRSIRGWLGARLLRVVAAVLQRLPEGPLHRVAHALGGILYRVQPSRRRLVRANLDRVVSYLSERGMG